MQAIQIPPMPTVIRSRLRSATEDPPELLDMPPPNMSESPPPRPLWSSTSRISSKLEITSRTSKTVTTSWSLTHRGRASDDRHGVEPADPAELVGLQTRSAHQRAVDVGLGHDRRDVRCLHGSAVQDTYAGRRLLAVDLADAGADRAADLLGVVGRGHLAGA